MAGSNCDRGRRALIPAVSAPAHPLRLHVAVDAQWGPALWVREQTQPGRSRALRDLTALLKASPPELAAVLSDQPAVLRARVTVDPGSREAASTRVPALPLPGPLLTAVIDAAIAALQARFGSDWLTTAATALENRSSVAIAPHLALAPDVIAACVLDREALALVQARQLRIVVDDRADGSYLRWAALTDTDSPLEEALIDQRARLAFRAATASLPKSSNDQLAISDPAGVIAALRDSVALPGQRPQHRQVHETFQRWWSSARIGVSVNAADSELVVRLHEPAEPTGRWLVQTCGRHSDGTVHSLDAVRAVGDVSAEGAIEASATVMRIAPAMRDATVDANGVDWLLTTSQASAFLSHDAALLEAAGIAVLLPRAWTQQRATVQARVSEPPDPAQAEATPSSGVGLNAMASFHWRLALGDQELTDAEMQQILEAQTELVHLREQWVRVDSASLRAATKFLDAFGQRAHRIQSTQLARSAASASRARAAAAPPAATEDPAARSATDLGARPDASTAEPPHPGTANGVLPWAQMFALLLSPEAASVEVSASFVNAAEADRNGIRTGATTSNGNDTADRTSTITSDFRALLPGGSGPTALPQPASLQATLRPYQLEGLNWMWTLDRLGLGGILADDMGLGKTMQVLALLCRERESVHATSESAPATSDSCAALPTDPHPSPSSTTRTTDHASPGPTLLVCPMSVIGAWQREASTFAPHLSVHVHHGGDRIRDDSFTAGALDTDLVITTYSLLSRDHALLASVPWHRIVFDEAQALKNPGTQVRTAAATLSAQHRLALTGTPVENRLRDLHSLLDIVNPGMLGDAQSFQDSIATPIEREADPSALSRLRLLTHPFVLRRMKTDRAIIADLPQKLELTRVVTLTAEQAGLYQVLVDQLLADLPGVEENKRRARVMSTLTALKQVCNHPAHYLGDGSGILRDGAHRSGKIEFTDGVLEEAFAQNRKVLVFTQFTAFGRMLAPYWEEKFAMPVPFLHGGVPKAHRDQMVHEFQQHPDAPGVMLVSLKAGGTGLTLTAANEVVHIDRWWNPAVENQATDRAYRIGQRRNVTVHALVSAGTVEEKVDEVLTRKQGLADLTIAPGEEWISQLDDQALSRLLSLEAQ